MDTKTKKQRTEGRDFDEVYDLIEDRLDHVGDIGTVDAKSICNPITYIPYGRFCKAFHSIMEIMVQQKKAIKVKNGRWKILKPNRRKVQA